MNTYSIVSFQKIRLNQNHKNTEEIHNFTADANIESEETRK